MSDDQAYKDEAIRLLIQNPFWVACWLGDEIRWRGFDCQIRTCTSLGTWSGHVSVTATNSIVMPLEPEYYVKRLKGAFDGLDLHMDVRSCSARRDLSNGHASAPVQFQFEIEFRPGTDINVSLL